MAPSRASAALFWLNQQIFPQFHSGEALASPAGSGPAASLASLRKEARKRLFWWGRNRGTATASTGGRNVLGAGKLFLQQLRESLSPDSAPGQRAGAETELRNARDPLKGLYFGEGRAQGDGGHARPLVRRVMFLCLLSVTQ